MNVGGIWEKQKRPVWDKRRASYGYSVGVVSEDRVYTACLYSGMV